MGIEERNVSFALILFLDMDGTSITWAGPPREKRAQTFALN